MTEWRVEGNRARARCRGYDIEARWGDGAHYMKTVAERTSATPGQDRPQENTLGIIVRVKSQHQEVDNVMMLAVDDPGINPEEAIRAYTSQTQPESLLPQHEDWIDEWSWLTKYRHRVRWQRRGNQANALMGHLILTVKLTTMKDAVERLHNGAGPEQGYGSNKDLHSPIEGFHDETPVFTQELWEDLSLIAAIITRASDEGAVSIREYTRTNDPVLVVTRCLAETYDSGSRREGHQDDE